MGKVSIAGLASVIMAMLLGATIERAWAAESARGATNVRPSRPSMLEAKTRAALSHLRMLDSRGPSEQAQGIKQYAGAVNELAAFAKSNRNLVRTPNQRHLAKAIGLSLYTLQGGPTDPDRVKHSAKELLAALGEVRSGGPASLDVARSLRRDLGRSRPKLQELNRLRAKREALVRQLQDDLYGSEEFIAARLSGNAFSNGAEQVKGAFQAAHAKEYQAVATLEGQIEKLDREVRKDPKYRELLKIERLASAARLFFSRGVDLAEGPYRKLVLKGEMP